MTVRIFDLHADLGWNIRRLRDQGEKNVLMNVHVPSLLQGGVYYAAAASYFEGTESWNDMKHMILLVRDEVEHSDVCWIRSGRDLNSRTPKVSIIMTVEGMCGIHSRVEEKIEWMKEQGVRIGSLCWNDGNDLAAGASADAMHGLTDRGRKAVACMNRLNMTVDVSHASEKTFWDILETSRKPVIATHSNARALCNVHRNLTDQQIDALGAQGGLIGMNSCREFIDADPANQDARHLARHARYIADRIGHRHVACGFDFMDFFEGIDKTNDLHQADQAQNFIKALSDEGFSEEQIKDIGYRNAFRFLKENLDR